MSSLPSILELTWDFRDQLKSTRRATSDKECSSEITRYVYDESGKRVRKVTEQFGNPGEDPMRTKETIYIGGGYELFRTYQGPRSDRIVKLEIETISISSGADRLVLVENRLHGGNPKIPKQLMRYQYSNRQGSVSIELDDHASLISYEEYTPYGSTSYQSTHMQTEVPKRYRWTGKEKDTESDLYHNGLRYYMADIGRWTSADPKGLMDGLNLYAYARANPVTFTDPTGTNSDPPKGGPKEGLYWVIPQLGQLRDYKKKGGKLKQDVAMEQVTGKLVLGHLMGVEEQDIIYQRMGGGPIDREISAGTKTYVDLSGNSYPLRNDPALNVPESVEKRVTALKTGIISNLKSGLYPGFDEWDEDNYKVNDQAAREWNQANPNSPKQFPMVGGKLDPTEMNEAGARLKATFIERNIPVTGWNKGLPAGPAAPAAPAGPTPSPSPGPTSGSKLGSVVNSLASAASSGAKAVTSKLKSGASSAVSTARAGAATLGTGLLRAAAPLFSEWEAVVTSGSLTYLAAAAKSPALASVASAIEAAPAAATYGAAAGAAIGGYVVGGLVGNTVKAEYGHTAGVVSAVVSGALVGAAIGSIVPGIGNAAGLVGGVVGGVAGAIAAWRSDLGD